MDNQDGQYIAPLRLAMRWLGELAGERPIAVESIVVVAGVAEHRARAYASILVKRRALAWDGDDILIRGPAWGAWYASSSLARPKAAESQESAEENDRMRRAICTEIRRQREAKGWSKSQLAAKAGVPKVYLTRSETRAWAPSVCASLRIARALGTTIEQLCGQGAAFTR
jgi:DNA-binding XRE family transcriptional regulator